ncbi:MAG: hypothetical protein HN742_08125 [Lentisphaerae bacterium]|jgi:hypothetical protein|nr:hypothetical protein [Lentisphaerota bacterium]MBT4820135.1 hypothetical protein [Lentisphaerota bacterium]MBT5613069.1 hypothetical protein [Lentisphaerota bacterium]MBT7059328.1 hypothetical protein [Lentisphaerota bacterium]MBT7841824.1 hypothetical protein [Lentisphaerota bacterium]
MKRTQDIPLFQILSVIGARFACGREVRIAFKERTAVGSSVPFSVLPDGFRREGDHRDVAELKCPAGIR